MPDHLHFLAEGIDENCDLIDFVRRFKQKTAYEAGARFGLPPLWQRYFYDHILRRTEAIAPVIWYIWLNPVRKEMCAAGGLPLPGIFYRRGAKTTAGVPVATAMENRDTVGASFSSPAAILARPEPGQLKLAPMDKPRTDKDKDTPG